MTLAGRTALVTGASRGIGASTARALAAAGARVILVARRGGALAELAAKLPGDPLVFAADLGSIAAIDELVASCLEQAGLPDLLVLNAGVFAVHPVGDTPLGTVDTMIDLAVRGPYHFVHHLVPQMRERGSGHVVTIGSVADHVAYPENSAYAMTKFAARGLHQVLRAELRGTGVRATLVSPGPVDTSIWDPINPETRPGFAPRTQMLQADDVADAVLWAVSRPAHMNVDLVRLGRS